MTDVIENDITEPLHCSPIDTWLDTPVPPEFVFDLTSPFSRTTVIVPLTYVSPVLPKLLLPVSLY